MLKEPNLNYAIENSTNENTETDKILKEVEMKVSNYNDLMNSFDDLKRRGLVNGYRCKAQHVGKTGKLEPCKSKILVIGTTFVKTLL